MKAKILPAVIAVAIPMLIGFVLTVCVVFISEQKRAEDLTQAYTESIARGVLSFFIEGAITASTAACLDSVQNLDFDAASTDFMALIRATRHVHRISLVDSEGYIYDVYTTGPIGNRWQGGRRTVDNSDPDAEVVNVSSGPHFRELVAENTSGDFYAITNETYVPHGMYSMAFVTSAPIIKEGNVIGMISVAQTALELSQFYEDITADFLDKFGEQSHLFLVSRGGNLISNLEYNEAYGAYMDERFGAAEIAPVFVLGDNAADTILASIENEKRVVGGDLHGEKHFIAGVKIDNTPFAVCLAVLESRMLHSSRIIAIIMGCAFAVTAVAVAIVFFAMSKSMQKSPEDSSMPRLKKRQGRRNQDGDTIADFAPPELPS